MFLGMRGRRSGRSIDFFSCFGGCHGALFSVKSTHCTYYIFTLSFTLEKAFDFK